MLLEGAIGDAYGAGFEFAKREKIFKKNNLTCYEAHPFYLEIKAKYTDDTQMAIGISELLLEHKSWTPKIIANKFVNVFKRDTRRGYSKGFYSLLTEVNSGDEMLERIIRNSDKNGAAMRAYPIGILSDEKEILQKCEIQASISHNTRNGILAAQAIALANHYFVYRKGISKNLLEYLQDIQKYKWCGKWKGEVGVSAVETVESVLSIILNGSSLKKMLYDSVAFGGDVDTVSSLVLAIGKMNSEVVDDLPDWMYNDIENEKFGRDFLIDLDDKLMNLLIV